MEFVKRKSPRLKEYDYSSNGAYFITVCTEGKKCVLSTVEEFVGEGLPLPKLTESGKILKKWIEKIPEKYPMVSVERFVIMPNHFHLLLSLSDFCENGRGNPSPTSASVDRGSLVSIQAANGRGNPSPTRDSVDRVLGWLKYNATREYNVRFGVKRKRLFQRSYHDHIIRRQKDFLEISRYIEENPLKWTIDCFYENE